MGTPIKGIGAVQLISIEDGKEAAAILSKITPHVPSGKIRARFNFTNGNAAFVLFSMLQGPDPLVNSSYHLIVKFGEPSRLLLVKGPVTTGTITALATGSQIFIPKNTNLAAQLEWQIDIKRNRIQLRGYVTNCESPDFGALQKRLEYVDSSDPFLSTIGEGFGFRENPDLDGPGEVIVDDVEIISQINILERNPSKIG